MAKEDDALRYAVEALIGAYVRLLQSGKDIIESLGGDCDPVDVMEKNDPYLRQAREALEASKPAPQSRVLYADEPLSEQSFTPLSVDAAQVWTNKPLCRDCADFGPICPDSGKPCKPAPAPAPKPPPMPKPGTEVG